jgi:CheY-like chemotaxis protein
MDKRAVFKGYVDANDVLIVDKNPSSRNRLLKIMYDLGCKRNMIHTAGSFQEAEDIISSKNVGVVLSDYFIAGGSGFDLFKLIRAKFPNKKELSLVLVTSNISQSAVAKAAEEDVDSFIIKPYTIQSIQDSLVNTISAKVKPSEYILKVQEAKGLIEAGKYDASIKVLQDAMKLHSKPALALFYVGQAEYLKSEVEKAQGSYSSGLNFNNIHYKCLVGLFDLFMKDSKFHEAYQVVKKIAKFFPANPDRLTQIIHLAVKTENYQDMQFYYEIFTSLEERSSIVTKYIGAGMYVSGKHHLLKKDIELASAYFDNIAVSCSEFTRFIRAIIKLLVDFDLEDEASGFLTRFPAGSNDDEDFLVSGFLINAKKAKDPNQIVKEGMDLYNRNIRDYDCMRLLIKAFEQTGYKEERIAPYREEMQHLWPEKLNISA